MGAGAGATMRRLARPAPPAAASPARALRLALSRAAAQSANLILTVLGVAEEEGPLDDLLSRVEDGLLALAVEAPGGLVALDAEARAAVVEALTLGRPLPQAAEARPPTPVDAALVRPVAQAFLDEVGAALEGTTLEGWLGPGGARAGAMLDGPREAGLRLADGAYRAVRLTLDLGAGGRQGLILLILPLAAPAAPPGEAPAPWPERLGARVLGASVEVRAILGSVTLPLAEVEGWAPGITLPLPGLGVATVRLRGPGQSDLGPARLGRVGDLRAVRIEAPLAPALAELAPPSA